MSEEFERLNAIYGHMSILEILEALDRKFNEKELYYSCLLQRIEGYKGTAEIRDKENAQLMQSNSDLKQQVIELTMELEKVKGSNT